MKARVAVFGVLRFPPENMENVLPHLKELVNKTYENDGCIAYDVAEDPFDRGLIRFSELWPNRESLEKHLVASHIEPWRDQCRKYGILEREFMSYDISSDGVDV